MVGDAQKANTLSAGHIPPNLEGNACKCQRLCYNVPTRPSAKCQRCVVRINWGFSDGRGSFERTAVDISIRHHVQASFKASFAPDATLLVYLEPKRFARISPSVWHHVQSIFGSGLSGPYRKQFPSRLYPRATQSARPRHLFAFCRSAEGGDVHNSHGRRTGYRMTGTPMLPDTSASQDWRTKCILDLSLTITPVTRDPELLPVYHGTVDMLARF